MANYGEELLEKYGIAYPSCGFGIGEGWVDLVETLIADLIVLGWDKDLHQVKEKFGGLRFYIGTATQLMYDRIARAERESYKTCEQCGGPGQIRRNGGWLHVSCDKH